MLELNQEQIQRVVGGAHANDKYVSIYMNALIFSSTLMTPLALLRSVEGGVEAFLKTVGIGVAAFTSLPIMIGAADILDMLLFPSPSAGSKKPNERKIA